MIKIVAENEVRGTIEKVYALKVDLVKKTEEIKSFNDGITFAVSSFYATDEEYLEIMKKMGSIIN